MKKLSLSVIVTVVVALLACGANLFLDNSLALSEGGGTPMSTSLITGVMRQRETTTVSTTTASTTSTTQVPTTQSTTTQAPTTTTPTTTQAPAATEPPTEAVVPQNVNYGTAGRLYLPDGVSVALYYYEITPENYQVAQAVTDRSDSATCGYDYGIFVISDHRTQEFGSLLNVTVGDTAHIDYPDGTRVNLVCTSCFNGYNNSYDLLDENGNNAVEGAPCDVIMRTCINSHGGIRLTYWCNY